MEHFGDDLPKFAQASSSEDSESTDICRVCRSAGDTVLYYPCLCTGSIKYVHQDCLLEWLKYSKKEVCELCSHKYSFQPIYRSDMPKNLPLMEVVKGILWNLCRLVRSWAVYTLVIIAWLGIVPITACRIYRLIFSSSLSNILSLPLQLFSLENMIVDCVKGLFIVSVFLCAFISLVWLREQILHGGPQEWLNLEIVSGRNGNPVQEELRAAVENARDFGDGEANVDINVADEEAAAQNGEENENWREWERVADELTWQRLLGLDGSLLFLEHVFWVISLNTIFTILFAFSPYQLGYSLLKGIGLASRIHYFSTLISILLGYIILSFFVRFLHFIARIFGFAPLYRILGICYLALKVFLLVLTEIGFFPILCGWWLDICSLPLFASTLSRRIASFTASPTSSLFLHWLIGMVYVFYSASFILILREVLRPGVLWFLRNLNDPEFNPIQEMIELPVLRHLRRLIASTSLFFMTIILIVYLPLNFIARYIPEILPFNLNLSAETPLSELSLELLMLQVVLPTLLEQTHARTILKMIVRIWCRFFGRLLNLEQYLLPVDEQQAPYNAEVPPEPVGMGLAAQHQALLLFREPQGFQTYSKPPYFPLRIIALLMALSFTSMLISVILLTLPVSLGRLIICNLSGHTNVHELYTIAVGLYFCWLILKLCLLLAEYAPRGSRYLLSAFRNTVFTLFKIFVVTVPILIIIPLLTGICFYLAVISPIRLAHHQTPLIFSWQHWAMGVLHCKIFCAGIMMGPDWWMRNVLEQIYADGFRGVRVVFLYRELVAPIFACLAIFLTAPRVAVNFISLAINISASESMLFLRYSYPVMLYCITCIYFIYWQCSKLKALAQKIRNDKYLVGTQLVNYEGKKTDG